MTPREIAPLKIVFMGTPDFAVPCLEALTAAGHDVVCAYSQPPRAAGRGQRARPSAVQQCAARHGISVRTPASLKASAEQAAFAALGADAAVVVAYGLILPQPILDAPRLGCFNLHGSLLPRWRGAAPIQRAIMAGDQHTGVSVMRMEAGLDTGPVVLEQVIPIGPRDTAGSLHDTMAAKGAALMVEALAGVARGDLAARPQATTGVTYADKISAAEGRIDWALDAVVLDRRIRGLSPWPGAWFEWRDMRIKVGGAAPEASPQAGAGKPGTVLDDDLRVACGGGVLRLLTLQRPGKAMLAAADFRRGVDLAKGAVLS